MHILQHLARFSLTCPCKNGCFFSDLNGIWDLFQCCKISAVKFASMTNLRLAWPTSWPLGKLNWLQSELMIRVLGLVLITNLNPFKCQERRRDRVRKWFLFYVSDILWSYMRFNCKHCTMYVQKSHTCNVYIQGDAWFNTGSFFFTQRVHGGALRCLVWGGWEFCLWISMPDGRNIHTSILKIVLRS